MGIDPAYGSSAFGIVVTEWADGIVQIMHAEEYHRPDYNEILSLVSHSQKVSLHKPPQACFMHKFFYYM